jgi:hypothetical protein
LGRIGERDAYCRQIRSTGLLRSAARSTHSIRTINIQVAVYAWAGVVPGLAVVGVVGVGVWGVDSVIPGGIESPRRMILRRVETVLHRPTAIAVELPG